MMTDQNEAAAQLIVILRCERSEPRRMGHWSCPSFEARKSAHLRMTIEYAELAKSQHGLV
jgi:hypothetical protein